MTKPDFVTEQQQQRVLAQAAADAPTILENERDWRSEDNVPMPATREEFELLADNHVEWLLETFDVEDDQYDTLYEWLLSVVTDALTNTSNQNEGHVELVRELGRELRAEHETAWYADADKIEEALRNWDRSERFDEQELAGSLFRALTEAGIEEWVAETLADNFALNTDPDLADDQNT